MQHNGEQAKRTQDGKSAVLVALEMAKTVPAAVLSRILEVCKGHTANDPVAVRALLENSLQQSGGHQYTANALHLALERFESISLDTFCDLIDLGGLPLLQHEGNANPIGGSSQKKTPLRAAIDLCHLHTDATRENKATLFGVVRHMLRVGDIHLFDSFYATPNCIFQHAVAHAKAMTHDAGILDVFFTLKERVDQGHASTKQPTPATALSPPGCPASKAHKGSLERLGTQNDEGNAVKHGTDGGFKEKYYCGLRRSIPRSDGRCGPSNGPQCASCVRFQDSAATAAARELYLSTILRQAAHIPSALLCRVLHSPSTDLHTLSANEPLLQCALKNADNVTDENMLHLLKLGGDVLLLDTGYAGAGSGRRQPTLKVALDHAAALSRNVWDVLQAKIGPLVEQYQEMTKESVASVFTLEGCGDVSFNAAFKRTSNPDRYETVQAPGSDSAAVRCEYSTKDVRWELYISTTLKYFAHGAREGLPPAVTWTKVERSNGGWGGRSYTAPSLRVNNVPSLLQLALSRGASDDLLCSILKCGSGGLPLVKQAQTNGTNAIHHALRATSASAAWLGQLLAFLDQVSACLLPHVLLLCGAFSYK